MSQGSRARKVIPVGKIEVVEKVESIEEEDEMIECGVCKSWTTMGKMNKERMQVKMAPK
jgi:hypothetical protein